MNINMEGIENTKEEKIELKALKGEKSVNRSTIRLVSETRSLPKDLKGLFVKIRIVAQYAMLGIMIFWFLFSLVSPFFRSADSNSTSLDVKRVDEMLGTLYKIA